MNRPEIPRQLLARIVECEDVWSVTGHFRRARVRHDVAFRPACMVDNIVTKDEDQLTHA
jgi:hypothetical protein